MIFSSSVFAQIQTEDLVLKKNSFGISVSGHSNPHIDDIPTIHLDYRRLIDNKNELRFSLDAKPTLASEKSSFGISMGYNRYINRSEKFNFYAGAELYNRNFNRISGLSADMRTFTQFKVSELGINTFLGLEYKPTDTFSFFIEPQIFSYSILNNSTPNGLQADFNLKKAQLFKGFSFGARIRF